MRLITIIIVLHCLAGCSDPTREQAVPAPTANGKPVRIEDGDVVLNGTFSYGTDHWAVAGAGAGASADAGRTEAADDQGLALHVSAYTATTQLAIQDIAVPEQIDSATFHVSYRMGGSNNAKLTGLQIGVGALQGTQFVPVLAIEHSMQQLPDSGWQDVTRTLSVAQRKQLTEWRATGARLITWVQLAGQDVRLHVDNVALRVTGAWTHAAPTGSLAYSVQSDAEAFRIETASPDGRTRRVLYTSPQAGAHTKGLAWSPDRTRLVFSSDHEMAWSPFTADLYAWSPQGVRRMTNAPSQEHLIARGLPPGGVTIKVRNLNTFPIGPVAIYVQGTRVLATISLPALGQGEVTLPEVADLGVGVAQMIVARIGSRTMVAGAGVDIQAGRTVTHVGELSISSLSDQQVTSPHFHRSGNHVVSSYAGLRTVPWSGGLPSTTHFGSLVGMQPAYAPTDDRLLYVGLGGIWLLRPGQAQAVNVVRHPSGGLAGSPVWLPDGSGFVYTAAAMHPTLQTGATQIYLQRFDNSPAQQLTDLFDLHAADLAVSPDGTHIACRRAGRSGAHGVLWVMPLNAPHRGWRIPTPGSVHHIRWR